MNNTIPPHQKATSRHCTTLTNDEKTNFVSILKITDIKCKEIRQNFIKIVKILTRNIYLCGNSRENFFFNGKYFWVKSHRIPEFCYPVN